MSHETSRQEQISIYVAAVEYACQTLGFEPAVHYFDRLLRLAAVNSQEELCAIVDGWCRAYHQGVKSLPVTAKTPPSSSDGPWAKGARWGNSTRVESDGGIMWKLKCLSCGKDFKTSTNDTVPLEKRQCPACCLAQEMSSATEEVIAQLRQRQETLQEWFKAHDRLVWSRVHRACDKRGIHDSRFKDELHALAWVKIAEVVGRYDAVKGKASGFVGTVATNAIRDHFKINDNRQRIAPTSPLASEEGRDAAGPGQWVPEKPVHPQGASGHDRAINKQGEAWDSAQRGWGEKPKSNLA